MAHRVTPIADLGGRFQEQGRIRTGIKDAKRGMKSIDTFRFTSPDQLVIEQLAELYGGTAKPWSDPRANPKNQWEVISQASEIRVWVGAQSISQWNEKWEGGGITRRCDGVVCTYYKKGDEQQGECVCNGPNPPKPRDLCKTKTRLTVLLPEVRLAGGWRLESSSNHAANEMPGMLALIEQVQAASGLAAGKLVMRDGISKRGGETRRYKYPQLILDVTAEQLMSGEITGPELTRADVDPVSKALPEAPVSLGADMGPTRDEYGNPVSTDDDVIEAEVVETPTDGWDSLEEAKQSGQRFKKNRGEGRAYVPS